MCDWVPVSIDHFNCLRFGGHRSILCTIYKYSLYICNIFNKIFMLYLKAQKSNSQTSLKSSSKITTSIKFLTRPRHVSHFAADSNVDEQDSNKTRATQNQRQTTTFERLRLLFTWKDILPVKTNTRIYYMYYQRVAILSKFNNTKSLSNTQPSDKKSAQLFRH